MEKKTNIIKEKFMHWRAGWQKIHPLPVQDKDGNEIPNLLPVKRVRELSEEVLVYGGVPVPRVAKSLHLKYKNK